MRNETIWAIRDARGLTTSEKAFLFVVESRGTARTYRKTLMNDTGASDGQITNLVRTLTAKGCLVTGRCGSRTTYEVSHEAVSRLVPDRDNAQLVSRSAQAMSRPTHSVSVEDSSSEDIKKNKKENTKKKLKKNMTAPVVANATPDSVENVDSSLQRAETESFLCVEHSPRPRMTAISATENGGLIFELTKTDGFTYLLCESGVTGPITRDPATPCSSNFADRTGADWRAIRRQRPLTVEEKQFIEVTARAVNAERFARNALPADDDPW